MAHRKAQLGILCVLLCDVAPGQQPVQPTRETSPVTAGFQDGEVPRGVFDLYYRTGGAGQPVLLLSGGPGLDCDYMVPIALDVAKSSQAILVELRGTGRSRPPVINHDTVNLAKYIEDLEALRSQLGLEHWTVLGHSSGGLLAMYYTAAHPDRVVKLILIDSVPVAFEFLDAMLDNILMRLGPNEVQELESLQRAGSPEPATMKVLLPGYFFDRNVGTRTAAEFAAHAYRHADVARLLGGDMTLPGYDLRPVLKGFENPVLILNGRQDPMDPRMAYETHFALKNSTVHFINRSGHFPWTEQPGEFYEIVHSFLK
jgi:proline iminopeptidase